MLRLSAVAAVALDIKEKLIMIMISIYAFARIDGRPQASVVRGTRREKILGLDAILDFQTGS